MTPLTLSLRGITKAFVDVVANDRVDLDIRAGEVHAVIGENGAGKSTLMSVIAGATRPDRGEMALRGVRFAPASPLEARERGVTLIHQELSLCPHLSVEENVLFAADRKSVV